MSPTAPGRNGLWKPVLLLGLVVAVLVLARVFHWGDKLKGLQDWIRSFGVWAPLVYGLVYVLAVIAAIPGSAVTLLGGGLFGSVLGTAIVSISSTVGAALSFLIARYFARHAVEKWVSRNEKFKKLDQMTARQGATIVAITRLVPVFPFNLLNYGFGLTRVGFWQYTFWSWVCMFPGTVLYVVAGDAAVKGIQGKVPWNLILVAVGILLALIFIGKGLKQRVR